MSIELGSHDLLEYSAEYGVLVCRECRYAIQKSALQSHLLRHKIYRGERQRLLASIAQLNLFEPDLVPLPDPTSPPISILPVISGYRCTVTGCGNLCASSKRMRRHRAEVHGTDEQHSPLTVGHPVKLQTFFRGTKLRYFEVAYSSTIGVAGAVSSAVINTTIDDSANSGHQEEDPDIDTAPSEPYHPRSLVTPLTSNPVTVDLETLTYFHYFTTTTSLTLPAARHSGKACHYWQTDAIPLALQRPWLMCGLLAISASHIAALAQDPTIGLAHRRRFTQLSSTLFYGLDETAQHDKDLAGTLDDWGLQQASSQVACILRCAHWALGEPVPARGADPEPAALFDLHSVITTIRNFAASDSVSRPGVVERNDGIEASEEDPTTRGMKILESRSSSDPQSSDASSHPTHTPSAILGHLRALPYRMAEAFGEPESVRDVLPTLTAIATLAGCCETSFASDEADTAWRGMGTWVVKVSDDFRQLVARHIPAALVVFAYWAALLVGRAEQCGCWFLKGAAKAIVGQVRELLAAEDHAVQRLLDPVLI